MHWSPKVRLGSALLGFAVALALPVAASASLFSGTWSVSGTVGNPVIGTVAPICKFVTAGNHISGSCRGPNAVGPATGSFSGRAIVFTWKHLATTSIGLTGLSVFRGTLGPDGVIRGSLTSPSAPRIPGQFTAMRP